MLTAAIGYVSLRGLGDETACRETMKALIAEVRGFNAIQTSRATNFSVRVISGPADAENIGLSPDQYLNFTSGIYPVVYLSLTYDPKKLHPHRLLEWETQFELKMTGRTASSLDILGLDPSPRDPAAP
jgi:hypothetical protein